ncbi:hypothetical protein PF010_g29256 [Phytophthora fragariae]|uniref:Uncharacterized protein n=1 Tax=Phytophthora fragariae TaxID=53985 RepID=A0A6G0JNR2_9STRA|nr:hypothetical protein PF010_g29256 [Phytophthora fragariae]
MVRKKARRSAFVSDSCFFLLRLKHELQNDARVMKAVVNEVDVLRLCHSLGMAVSDDGNRVAMRAFEFGLFSPSSYDADFARFIREKFAADGATNQEEQVEIGCLFGRQCGVKAELTRMGLWRSDWGFALSQGVYCIEKGGGGGGHRQFIAFAWLNTSLFEPDAIRDTPAYVLRFLMSLSSSVSCCLSRDDFHLLKREVDAASSGTTMQWNSCSVAFRVQKQEKQSDNVRCAKPTKAVLPSSDPIKSVEFIGGVFPAVAVESAAPSTTEWVTNNASMSIDKFTDWVMELHSRFKVELPRDPLRPALVRDSLLEKFDSFPKDEMDKFRKSFEDKIAKAKQRIDRNVSEKTEELHKVMGQNADMLFAVRTPAKAPRIDKAREQYNEMMQTLDSHEVLGDLDDEMRIALRMLERMQANMEALHEAYVNNSSRYEALLNEVANGTPAKTADNSSHGGLWKVLGEATRGAIRWMRSANEQFSEFSINFILALEPRQSRLQRRWFDAVEYALSKLGPAMRGQRVFQSTNERKTQWEQGEERVFDEAYLNLRSHLMSSNEHPLCAKISSIRLNHDDSAANVKWSKEVEKDCSHVALCRATVH